MTPNHIYNEKSFKRRTLHYRVRQRDWDEDEFRVMKRLPALSKSRRREKKIKVI